VLKVRLSPSARRDLREITGYLREQAGPAVAKKYSALLRKKLATLSRDALRYRERKSLGPGRRAILFGP
jgi:plasmid stabilization system protein ParE